MGKKPGPPTSELDRAVGLLVQTDDYDVIDKGEDWAELVYAHNAPPHPVTRIEIREPEPAANRTGMTLPELIAQWREVASGLTAAGYDEGFGSGLSEAADELEDWARHHAGEIVSLRPRACDQPEACAQNACPEHPRHNGPDHTWEQHHSRQDHQGPGPCRCIAAG